MSERAEPVEQAQPASTDSCWDLAIALAAHNAGGGRLSPEPMKNEIFQVSTMTALAEGLLDGDTPYAEVMRHGDFGVGTFNALNGEMAAVDGDFYHLFSDGSVTPVDPDDLTPFVAVTSVRGEAELDVREQTERDQLLESVDDLVPSENLFYAIRIDGSFARVRTRTVVDRTSPIRLCWKPLATRPRWSSWTSPARSSASARPAMRRA